MRLLVAAILLVLAPLSSAQFMSGRIYVADWKATIWEVDPASWTVTSFATGLNSVSALAWSPDDRLLASMMTTNEVLAFDALGGSTVRYDATDGLNGPYGENGIAVLAGGGLVIANFTTKEVLAFPGPHSGSKVLCDAADGVEHADGLAFDAAGSLWIANREAKNLLKVGSDGKVTEFDKDLPDQPMSIAVRDNGDVYVAIYRGDVYRYVGGQLPRGSAFYSAGGTAGTPTIRFSLDFTTLYYVSYTKGYLLTIDPDTAVSTKVLPDATFTSAVSLEVVGARQDVGIYPHDDGVAGSGGFVPSLLASGHPISGTTLTLELRDFLGGTLAALLIGVPFPSAPGFGQTGAPPILPGFPTSAVIFLTLPGAPGVAGEGDLDLASVVPSEPFLDSSSYDVRAFGFDPAATAGWAWSNALRITVRAR